MSDTSTRITKYKTKNTDILTYEVLHREYIVNQKAINIIACELNVSKGTLQTYLKKFNLHTRDKTIRPFHKKGKSIDKYKDVLTKEFLIEKCIDGDLNVMDLVKETGIAYSTIRKYFEQYELVTPIGKQSVYSEYEDLSGKILPKYKVIDKIPKTHGPRYNCLCNCGRSFTRASADIKKAGIESSCNKCDNYEDIQKGIWTNYIKGAKLRHLSFNITKEYVWKLYLEQNKNCYFLGIPIFFKNTSLDTTCSIDRIDGSIGYEVGNIRIVHKAMNMLKGNVDNITFIHICKLVAENHKELDTSHLINTIHKIQNVSISIPK